MFNRNRRQRHGFTFVEVLVSISILSVVAAVLFAGLAPYMKRQQYKSEVNELAREIIEQRARSISAIGNTVHGVYVASTSVTFFSGTGYTPGDPNNRVLELDYSTIEFSLTNSTSTITFDMRTGTSSATGTMVVVGLATEATSTLTLYATGLLQTD